MVFFYWHTCRVRPSGSCCWCRTWRAGPPLPPTLPPRATDVSPHRAAAAAPSSPSSPASPCPPGNIKYNKKLHWFEFLRTLVRTKSYTSHGIISYLHANFSGFLSLVLLLRSRPLLHLVDSCKNATCELGNDGAWKRIVIEKKNCWSKAVMTKWSIEHHRHPGNMNIHTSAFRIHLILM